MVCNRYNPKQVPRKRPRERPLNVAQGRLCPQIANAASPLQTEVGQRDLNRARAAILDRVLCENDELHHAARRLADAALVQTAASLEAGVSFGQLVLDQRFGVRADAISDLVAVDDQFAVAGAGGSPRPAPIRSLPPSRSSR